jgi:NTE family protein
MEGSRTSFFEGLTVDKLAPILERLERRRFPAGTTLMAEGDTPGDMYVILTGTADIVLCDRHGREHHLTRVGSGAAIGDMSLLTGQPASATVRATGDLEVLVLGQREFQEIGRLHPRIYRNLFTILSERLARSNRRILEAQSAQIGLLNDSGAPPLLGYALACSVAWHTRTSTLLLVLTSGPPPPELVELADAHGGQPVPEGTTLSSMVVGALAEAACPVEPCAHLVLATPTGAFAPGALAVTLEDLSEIYDQVLLQVTGDLSTSMLRIRERVRLGGPTTPPAPGAGRTPVCTVRGWTAPGSPPCPGADGLLDVPALMAEDERGLRDGRLPSDTPAGRALGWAARHVARLKVGLALGAGTERGYAHIGVLRVLERIGLPIDYLTGASVGSAVAAAHALGYDPDGAALVMDMLSKGIFRPALPIASLLSNAGLRARIRGIVGETRIEELPVPLAVVAADITTRREVVFRHGLLAPALLASMAIPGIYPAQLIGPYMLVDGGVLNPVPGNVAAEMGADVVVGVKLPSPPALHGVEAEAAEPQGKPPSVFQVLMRAIEMTQSKIATETAAKATILIEPAFTDIGAWGLRNFSKGRVYMELGEEAAEAALPRLSAALPWLRTPDVS